MSRSHRHQALAENVPFPVTPMLDMAFQLLAFFVLTFQPPSRETRIDLYLPVAPAALPRSGGSQVVPASPESELDLENDLVLRARADARGRLSSLELSGETITGGAEALGERLSRYASLLGDQPLNVRLVADDSLSYEEAAKILGTLEISRVASIRLAAP
jgi:biopolymer transport protein ExbD